MKLQQFINKYSGKKVDYDKKFGAQCVDLYRFYLRDVWKLPQTPPVKGAYQIMNTLPKTYDKFINGLPQAGDVVTWNEQYTENGHVAIVIEANGSKFKSFDQNNPPNSPCAIRDHTYKNVIGWFRPRKVKMTYYVERPSEIDPSKVEIGIATDYGEETIIRWATDPAWGDQMSKHFKPTGVYKILPK